MRNVVSKFTAWITTLAPKAATADDMLLRFGSRSPAGRDFISWCYYLFNETATTFPIISESFEIWKSLYKEATNLDDDSRRQVRRFASQSIGIKNPDVEKFLFCIETYLALIMKFLVAEVAIQKNVVQATTLRQLIGKDAVEGYLSLRQRIIMLGSIFEEDVFDWFLEPTRFLNKKYHNQCQELVSDIIDSLDGLNLKDLKIDLIRDLYHGFFDVSTRRALGEFYTKDEIIHEILDYVKYRATPSNITNGINRILLDASCGSGSFLIGAIDLWRPLIKSHLGDSNKMADILLYLTTNIVGIDIHPFAVAMARVNYLLAILDLLTPEVLNLVGEVRIPIYWSDSLVKEKHVEISPIVDIEIPKLGAFQFPSAEEIPHDLVIAAIMIIET
jgi:hypothetical protein